MNVLHWKTPIKATWHRALELVRVDSSNDRRDIVVREDDGTTLWTISFVGVVYFSVVSEERSYTETRDLPTFGALYIINDSPLVENISRDMSAAITHYVICLYDEVITVVAQNASVAKCDS